GVLSHYPGSKSSTRTRRLLMVKTSTIFVNRLLASRWRSDRRIGTILVLWLLCGGGVSLVNAAGYEDGTPKAPAARNPAVGEKASAPVTDSSTDSKSTPDSKSTGDSKAAPTGAADADKINALDDKVRKLEDIIKQQQLVIDSLQNRLDGIAGSSSNPAAAPAGTESAKQTPA